MSPSAFFRSFFGSKQSRTMARPHSRNRCKPVLEILEDRTVLSTITWSNPVGDSWQTPANWDLKRVPTTGDDVVIPDLAGTPTITYSSGTSTIQSLTTSENVALSGGTLNVTATIQGSGGKVTLQGATLAGATIAGGVTLALTNSGGTLAGGIVIAAGVTVDATQQSFGNTATITGGLTLNGTLNLGAANASTYGQLTFQDTQALSGSGTVVFGGSTSNALYVRGGNIAATLTIGSGITIQGGSGAVSCSSSFSNDSVVNNAAITEGSGQTLTLDGITSNTGIITAASGATFNLSGVNWVNTGSITANGATVKLGGSFRTADLGSFSATNGTVNLAGTLNNAGTTLALAPALGSWHLNGGTISGGTITSTGGVTLALTNSGGALAGGIMIAAGVTVDATQQSFGNTATITGGLTLNGTLNLGAANASTYGQLTFQDTQALSGSGTVVFGGSTSNALYVRGGNIAATLTIGSGISIQGGSGAVSRSSSFSNDSVVNNAAITEGSGQTLTLDGITSNTGTIMAASGATFNLSGVNWVNTGSITANGATVKLAGSFRTADLGSFSATNGTVNLAGTLNNAGTTLALAPALGSWQLYGGTISGGTITSTGGVTLALTNSGGTLAGGVVIAAGVTVDATQQSFGNTATVTGGLTLNGTLNLGAANAGTYGQVTFQDTQALNGSGAVVFGGSTSNALYVRGGNIAATLTIGSGISIQGGSGAVSRSSSFSTDSIFNNASITEGSGQTLTLDGITSNTGTITVASGATFNLSGVNWVNTGSITANGATVKLGGSFRTADLGSFSATNGMLNLAGTLNNAGTTLALAPALGSWYLNGGTISGGTITSTGGVTLALTNRGGTLAGGVVIGAGVTVDATQQSFGNTATITGGLTLNGTLNLGTANASTYGQVTFQDTQALSGSGTVVFGGSTSNALYVRGGNIAATLTIGSGISIQGGSGAVSRSSSFSNDSVVINGPINIANGGALVISNSLQVDGSVPVTVTADSSLAIGRNLLGTTQNITMFQPLGTITLNGSGTSTAPQLLEAMSADLGSGPTGFTNNLAYGAMTLANNTYVKLVDQSHNSSASGAEAVYVNSLVVPAGCTLDLHGLHLYAAFAQVAPGTITGGSYTLISFHQGDHVQIVFSVGTSDSGEADEVKAGDAESLTLSSSAGFQAQVNVFNTQTLTYTIQQDGETFSVSGGDTDETAITRISATSADQVTVTSPNGGEIWQLGVAHPITWSVAGDTSQIDNFFVSYSLDGGSTYSNDVGTASGTSRSISWTPPLVISPTAPLRIRVQAKDTSGAVLSEDASDIDFTLASRDAIFEILAKGYVYSGHQQNDVTPYGYTVKKEFTGTSGFYALGLESANGDTVLVFRGTQRDNIADFLTDLAADFDFRGVGFVQFADNRSGIEDWLDSETTGIRRVSLIGHSLGGALAQWVAADYTHQGKQIGEVVTFNSPGISQEYADHFQPGLAAGVMHYITNGDLVSMAGEAFLSGSYTVSSFSHFDINLLDKHLLPVLVESIGNSHRPELTTKVFDSVDSLNNPLFVYSDKAYYAFVGALEVAVVAIAAADPLDPTLIYLETIPPALIFRGSTEANRQLIGTYAAEIVNSVFFTLTEITDLGMDVPSIAVATFGVAKNAANQLLVSAVSALNNLKSKAAVTVNLAKGVFTDVSANLSSSITFIVNGVKGFTTINGHSPALTVSSGTVIAQGIIFTTPTASPTILVNGGNLILRDCTIEESTGGTYPAIAFTGGNLDLGATDSPGNNIINVNGTGEFVHNTTANSVPATGNTFSINDSPLAAPFLSYTNLSSSVGSSVFGQNVTFTATVTANTAASTSPSGTVDFFDNTINTDLGTAPISGGVAPLTTSALAAGKHAIVARYSGDKNYLPSMDLWAQTVGEQVPLPSNLLFTVASYRAPRTAGTAVATVVRTGGLSGIVTVVYATSNGTAQSGTDYTSTNGTLTFGPVVSTQTISIPVLDDHQTLGDETVNLTLSSPTGGATLDTPSTAVLTINDPLPQDPLPRNLAAVANVFTHGREAYAYFITGAYRLYLKRTPEAGGLAYWVDQMLNRGLTDERLEAGFLGSVEYIQNHGGTGSAWVIGMYEDLLGRDPDAAGLAYWTGILKGGGAPSGVAFGFAASNEREGQRIGADYQIYLGRGLDPQGLAYWLNQFVHGARNEDVVGGFVGSSEYFVKVTKGQNNRLAWLDSAFEDIFHRAATDKDIAFWNTQL